MDHIVSEINVMLCYVLYVFISATVLAFYGYKVL